MSNKLESDGTYSLKCGLNSFVSTYIVGILHPLDVIKTRIQSHDGKSRSVNLVPQYRGIFDALKSIYKYEGIRGLYKGYHISMLTQASVTAMFFWLQQMILHRYELRKIKHLKAGSQDMTAVALASGEASLFGTIVTQPLWVIRTRMLLNTNPSLKDYDNFIFSCRQINQQHGWKGYGIGLNISLFLSGIGVLQMFVYEGTKKLYELFNIPRSVLAEQNFICGALSKFFSVLISYPLTTVRTRAQQNQYVNESKSKKYSGTIQIIRRTYRDEGVHGFYKGFHINLMRGIMQKGMYFYIYQFFKDLILGRHQQQMKIKD